MDAEDLVAELLSTGQRQWPHLCSLIAADREIRDECWKQVMIVLVAFLMLLVAGNILDKIGWGFIEAGGTMFSVTAAAEKASVETQILWVFKTWSVLLFCFGV